MSATVRRSGAALVVAIGFVLAGCGFLAGCGSGHGANGAGTTATTTALIRADHWAPPTVSGGPSVANFCTLLVADYQHVATNTRAATLAVRTRILQDYVNFTPTVVAAAPPEIAPAARLYLQSVASVVSALVDAGLNPAKAKPGAIANVIGNPQVQQASQQVTAYAQQRCHYDITGAT